ncbi:Stage II sporulation protein AC [Streptococcus pneumoniae]|nr:Stage II sporulation protein AC [Streptococcus pneumoniae]CKE42471.1 Stage II sporulation protein AC [Streptococcus pneumoniae]
MIAENSKEPTAMDIAKVLEVTHEEIVFALDAIQDPVSLFEPIYNDGGDPIFVMDQLSDEKQKDEQWVEELALKEGMKRLNDREKMIIRKRFFQGKTQMEVAEEIGISQAQVSRLEKSAIKQMNKTIQG